jgi:hypothetical protein
LHQSQKQQQTTTINMVQNQNWQRRVESAEGRRKESKQRKQRADEKRAMKLKSQEFCSWLDRHNDAIQRRIDQTTRVASATTGTAVAVTQSSSSLSLSLSSASWELHIWTDTMPLETVPYMNVFRNVVAAQDGGGGGSGGSGNSGRIKRDRSASLGDVDAVPVVFCANSKKGRARSGSLLFRLPTTCQTTTMDGPGYGIQKEDGQSIPPTVMSSSQGRNGRQRSESLPIIEMVGSDMSTATPPPATTTTTTPGSSSNCRSSKGRNRSGSFPHDNTQRKSNSKTMVWSGSILEKPEPEEDNNDSPGHCSSHNQPLEQQITLRLCQNQFFANQCLDRSNCQNVHYNNQHFKTLSSVLHHHHHHQQQQQQPGRPPAIRANSTTITRNTSTTTPTLAQKELYMAEDAATIVAMGRHDPGSMEMLYYLSLPLNTTFSKGQESGDLKESITSTTTTTTITQVAKRPVPRLTDLVSKRLTANACSWTSLVYVALSTPTQTILMYDRNREGRVIADLVFTTSVLNDKINHHHHKHNNSIPNEEDSLEGDLPPTTAITNMMRTVLRNPAEHIPISVLEHILEYANAPAVVVASQVCTAWHREIQDASPQLWKHFLEQRSWPLPPTAMLLLDCQLQGRTPKGSDNTAPSGDAFFQRSDMDSSNTSNGTTTTTTTTTTAKMTSESCTTPTTTTNMVSNHCQGLQDQDTASHTVVANLLREEFIRNYSVRRELLAIQQALKGLLPRRGGGGNNNTSNSNPKSSSETTFTRLYEQGEMAVHTFSTRRGAPQPPSHCVAVEIWSPNCVLAAYSHDCTLRLFQAVSKGGSGGNDSAAVAGTNEKHCREVLCQRIDPYKYTRKKTCIIETMGLDETVVGCLCRIADETTLSDTNRIRQRYNLVVIHRDDLLVFDSKCADSGISEPEEDALTVIDVEVAVLNYVLTLEHVDHRLLRLHDFLTLGGGDMEDVELLVSPTLATCGAGCFMVEVAISIPSLDDGPLDDDDQEALRSESGMVMELIDRKLFLFSSTECAIVWMGESHSPSDPLRPRLEDMSLVSLRTSASVATASGTDRSRTSFSVAAVSLTGSPTVTTFEMVSSGHFRGSHVFEDWTSTLEDRVLDEGWTESRRFSRSVVVSPTDVVVGGTLVKEETDDDDIQYKAILTFYSRRDSNSNEPQSKFTSKLVLGENCAIESMVSYRSDYVVVICRVLSEMIGDQNGQFHTLARMSHTRVYAAIIHLPSRQELERMCLYEDYDCDTFPKLCLSVFRDTVACGVGWKGLIMTGSDVRSPVGDCGKQTTSTSAGPLAGSPVKTPKKKMGKRRQSGKKDRFVRGLSLRG